MENIKCTHCGSDEYFIGQQNTYAELTVKLMSPGTPIKHEVCLNCGTIRRSYIEKIEKFRKYQEK